MISLISAPRLGKEADRGVDCLDLLGIAGDIGRVEMPDDADPQPFEAVTEHGRVVGDRLVSASGVPRIMSGDHLEH